MTSAAAAPVKGKDVQLKYLVKRLQWTKTRSPGKCLTCQEIWTVLNYACMLLLLLTMGVGGLAANAPLSMDLHPFETAVLMITVLLVGVLIQTGESNWLAGLVLVMAYVIISIGFFYHTDTRYEDVVATTA